MKTQDCGWQTLCIILMYRSDISYDNAYSISFIDTSKFYHVWASWKENGIISWFSANLLAVLTNIQKRSEGSIQEVNKTLKKKKIKEKNLKKCMLLAI